MQRLVSMLQQAEDYVGTVVDGNLPADPHMGRKVLPLTERLYVLSYGFTLSDIPGSILYHAASKAQVSIFCPLKWQPTFFL